MFEKRRAQRAETLHAEALAAWKDEFDELASVLQTARAKTGMPSQSLVLKTGEAVFARVTGVGLIEMRSTREWQGGSQGISIPIGSIGGRSVRYRVGNTKGHSAQGTPAPQAVDRGEMNITNQRIVFIGASKTLECQFPKLVALQQGTGQISVSVSNRPKPTVLNYGASLDGWVKNRLSLALSIFHGKAEDFADSVAQSLKQLEATKPTPARLPLKS